VRVVKRTNKRVLSGSGLGLGHVVPQPLDAGGATARGKVVVRRKTLVGGGHETKKTKEELGCSPLASEQGAAEAEWGEASQKGSVEGKSRKEKKVKGKSG